MLTTGGCRREPAAPRLVLLYAPCTVNRDSLAPYGAAVRYTPNLAAFARESVVFLRHQTETDQSGPAYASLFAERRPTGTASTAIPPASATSST